MPTWLVVEDEPDIYDVLLAMFGIWGIEGVAFVDGPEAIAWIDEVDQGQIRGDLPELAMLDIRLPEVGGPEVGAHIRRSPVLHDIAIVLITAYKLTPEEERAAMATSQADLLLYKPLPPMTELKLQLNEIIAKHGGPDLSAITVSSVDDAPNEVSSPAENRENVRFDLSPSPKPTTKPTTKPFSKQSSKERNRLASGRDSVDASLD